MEKTPNSLAIRLGQKLTQLGIGIRVKLVCIFVLIKVLPLILLALLAWKQSSDLGEDLKIRTGDISVHALEALEQTGKISVHDAVEALDNRATAEIERMSTDAARAVADFLYGRDADILFLASLTPDAGLYRHFVEHKYGSVGKTGRWVLAPDGKSWQPENSPAPLPPAVSTNEENNVSFHYRPPDLFNTEKRPLYLEATFVDLDGMERIKVTTSPRLSDECKNVASRANTFVKAETYFAELRHLKPGEIYVSDVIGAYVGSNYIGMYTPENLAARNLPYEPEKQAYAGKENPNGIRFRGIVRWATPVERDGKTIGYVTLALDHDHIMEFVDRLTPVLERYTELPSAYEGNYAFIWDHKGRSICHPRHHSIVGYDPETGDPQVAWLEKEIYEQWQASGRSYADFIETVPTFQAQSNSKKPAAELTRKGLVGLDCRYLNFAPQCTGWFDLTKDGGSGSFRILWSGLWKLNTAAAIPYYTGQYGKRRRGFGFVAVGAGLDDFHSPAIKTQKTLQTLIKDTKTGLDVLTEDTYRAIGKSLWDTAMSLSVSTGIMSVLVILIAVWMASILTKRIAQLIRGLSRFRAGERQFRFDAPVKDEMGTLCDSFDTLAETLIKSEHEPLWTTDASGNIRYMNDQALALVGKTLDEVVGKPYRENTVIPADTEFCPLYCLKTGSESKVYLDEKSGQAYVGSAQPVFNNKGELLGHSITIRDITKILEEQRQAERQNALITGTFVNSTDLLWYQDKNCVYQVVNPRYASLLDIPPEDFQGRLPTELFPGELGKLLLNNARQVLQCGKPTSLTRRTQFADGHVEDLDIDYVPLFNAKGEVNGLIGSGRNVTEREAIEQDLRNTKSELEEAVIAANKASEAKSAFLSHMSHEIRTPMNAIIGMTSITKKKLDSGVPARELVDNVNQIDTAARHLLGLLNDILDISKIEAGKIELSEAPFDLIELTRAVEAIIQPRCTEKNISFVVDVEGIEHPSLVGDQMYLRQVLLNLLGNATKFTPDLGKIHFRVWQESRENGQSVISFSVKDNGVGITEEQLKTLFRPFEQGGSHVSHTYGGTGLGLSICKGIIELMGGEISVESSPGKGSTFFFTLRFLESTETVNQEDEGEEQLEELRGNVLVVDDVEINRLIICEQLSELNLHIDEAADGKEAVDAFARSPENFYNLILMDMHMPNMDGIEATRAIRAMDRPDAASVTIIAVTANAFKDDVDAALGCGMNGHMSKPLEIDQLMKILASTLKRERERERERESL